MKIFCICFGLEFEHVLTGYIAIMSSRHQNIRYPQKENLERGKISKEEVKMFYLMTVDKSL